MGCTRVGLPAVLCLLLVAAPARAGTVTYGSDLSADAVIAHSRPNDAVYFNDGLGAGGTVDAGVTGQVVEVSIKGRIVPSAQTLAGGGDPFNVIHFQVLRPNGDGSWTVPKDATSTDYSMPWSGDDNQVTTFKTTHQYDALCVKPGDRLDLATLGGYDANNGYPDGTPFRVFGRVPGSRVLQYSAAGTEGVHNESTFRPTDTHADEELLMRWVVGTGDDARPACRGSEPSGGSGGSGGSGSTPTVARTLVTLPPQRPRLPRNWRLSVAGYCHATTACRGTLIVRAKGKRIGRTRFEIGGRATRGIKVRFTKRGRRMFRRSGKRLTVTLKAVTDPGGAANTDKRRLVVTKRS